MRANTNYFQVTSPILKSRLQYPSLFTTESSVKIEDPQDSTSNRLYLSQLVHSKKIIDENETSKGTYESPS